MASGKEIKRRIRSIRNTKKITKAMELVAASKMRRAVANTLASRTYAEYSWEVLNSVSRSLEEITHPLFTAQPVPRILLVLITSNRGLCGSYNAQVIKRTFPVLKGGAVDIVAVGRKGDAAARRLGQNVLASFELPDHLTLADVVPLANFLVTEYKNLRYGKILVAYTDFISVLTQRPNLKQVLPVSRAELKNLIDSLASVSEGIRTKKINYLIEGDREMLIGALAEKLTRMQIYQMLLESHASEQSARMVAMKNASDASGEMIDDLTLVFNKVRQANITKEISEISAGMASI